MDTHKITTTPQATNIDEVISILDQIIERCKQQPSTLGYFAALYRKVTVRVKEGIVEHFFDDGPRMEQLDVVFANRYIQAYFDFAQGKPITKSWLVAFDLSTKYWPIVLQHLLIGMNAHINLDLGIAAAEVMEGKNIKDLENDFNKINSVLSALVVSVQQGLSAIWPTLKFILKFTARVDDFLIDFSMKEARNGAWKFACSLANKQGAELAALIAKRDQRISEIAQLVSNPGFFVNIIFGMVRLGERGTISEKITDLQN